MRTKAIIYFTILFLLGAVSGGMFGYNYGKKQAFRPPQPDHIARFLRERLQSSLNLTPEQVMAVKPAVDTASCEFFKIHTNSLAQVEVVFKQLNEILGKNLDASQMKKLEQMDRDRRQMIHRGRPRPGKDNETNKIHESGAKSPGTNQGTAEKL